MSWNETPAFFITLIDNPRHRRSKLVRLTRKDAGRVRSHGEPDQRSRHAEPVVELTEAGDAVL